jgi:hypothetical protein
MGGEKRVLAGAQVRMQRSRTEFLSNTGVDCSKKQSPFEQILQRILEIADADCHLEHRSEADVRIEAARG